MLQEGRLCQDRAEPLPAIEVVIPEPHAGFNVTTARCHVKQLVSAAQGTAAW